MKNYINKHLSIGAIIMLCIACDSKLDLKDPQIADEEIALATEQNVQTVLTGAYDALSASHLFGGNVLRNSELLGANDEISFTGTYSEPKEFFNKSIISVNANVADFWISGYGAINNVNNVLSALDVVSDENKNQVEGEALFIRGLTYFELVKYFGEPYSDGNASTNEAVPIVLKPGRVLGNDSYVSRETVENVYDQILADLTKAATLLDSIDNATRTSKEAALAILSRVYLQMGDFTKARDAANAVLKSGKFELVNTYSDCFDNTSTSEDIFNIPVSTSDGVNDMWLYYASSAEGIGGRGDIQIEEKHLNLYEEGDDRLGLFYEDEVDGAIRTGKWLNQYGSIKVLRLAEMYLTRAEANFRLGEEVGDTPLNDINTIRARVNLDPLNTVDLDTILYERRLELAHEGHRIHDIKRLKQSVIEGSTTYTYDDPKLVFPIPQRERNVNKNLTQNPGYGNN